jgi:Rps23 Pro-64 3,4-dihydroxylase Tpa1-like proline 4-hydroxylase
MDPIIAPLDIPQLRQQWQTAEPFPHFKIDGFLDDDFAREVAAAYPTFEQAVGQGRMFNFVNEQKKVQICDRDRFASPIRRLSDAVASPEFRAALTEITGIESLLDDPDLEGGGIHVTGPRGRLDVHVDFNYVEAKKWHRRLNFLLYLNPVWQEEWGGHVELWSQGVRQLHHSFRPILNRVVVFETSEISFHGVAPVTCPEHVARQSFASYYYTKEAPVGWDGQNHSTIFQARPEEMLRQYVLMPAEKLQRRLRDEGRRARRLVGRVLKR